jgi:probable O-glycosylation ligase (exosortase A-associated)
VSDRAAHAWWSREPAVRAEAPLCAGAAWWQGGPAPARPVVPPAPAPAAAGDRTAFWSIVAFTVVLLLAPQNRFPALEPLRPAFLTAGVALLAYLAGRLRRGRRLSVLTPEIAAAGALLAWAIVTAPLSVWPGGTAAFLTGKFLKVLLVFWLLCNVIETRARLRTMAWTLSVVSAPLALTAIWNLLAGITCDECDSESGGTRAVLGGLSRIRGYDAPLTLNPNDLALALALGLPLTLALLFATAGAWKRAALAAIALLAAVAVVCTYSRGGFVTLVVVLALSLWRLVESRRARWIAVGALAGVLALGVPFLPDSWFARIGTIADAGADRTGSSHERWRDLGAALEMIARDPLFGAGAGMHHLALNDLRGDTWLEVHNVYLEIAGDLGLPGLALFLVVLGGSLRRARHAALGTDDRPTRLLARAIGISLVGFAVAGLVYPVAYDFFFYYYAALAIAAHRVATDGPAIALPARYGAERGAA